MNLESVILSEISQKEENRYMGSRKMVLMNTFAGKEWRKVQM